VTATIFLSSVGHAAANFCQYDEYAFPPNYPAILNGKAPTTKVSWLKNDTVIIWLRAQLFLRQRFQIIMVSDEIF